MHCGQFQILGSGLPEHCLRNGLLRFAKIFWIKSKIGYEIDHQITS